MFADGQWHTLGRCSRSNARSVVVQPHGVGQHHARRERTDSVEGHEVAAGVRRADQLRLAAGSRRRGCAARGPMRSASSTQRRHISSVPLIGARGESGA